jgi:electron transfer flavoprotein alpha/beta subunit
LRIVLGLHAMTVTRTSPALHPSDRRALALARGLGAAALAIEALGTPGLAPRAVHQALAAGAAGAVRVIDAALAAADAHTTGFVLAEVMRRLDPDLILFAEDTDPDGALDVPAALAHRLGVPYVPQAVDVSARTAASVNGAPSPFEVTLQRGPSTLRARLPRGAVVGVTLDRGGATHDVQAPDAGATLSAIEILTLADLGIDPSLVRRRNDLRGVVEPAGRPALLTTTAVASLADWLR